MALYQPSKKKLNAISADELNRGKALSFKSQPNLRKLFDALNDDEVHITLIVGAGASSDAGFPTWNGLLDELISRIENPTHQKLARADTTEDPMRRAESILRLLNPSKPEADVETFREILYKETPETEPGEISSALAALCITLGKRCSLMTTNFDDVLEEALRISCPEDHSAEIESFSAKMGESGVEDGYAAWKESQSLSVIHLHGMLRRQNSALEPIVLTESQFLEHGPHVREIVEQGLKESVVIFVGVSLTDPNLIAPLWEHSKNDDAYPSFVLHVPSRLPDSDSIEESREYALKKYEYLELQLNTNPIFLKSYSQLHQCLREMNLCIQSGSQYFENEQNYGMRFSRILDHSYAALGMSESPIPSMDDQLKVSRLLGAELGPQGRIGRILHDADPSIASDFQSVKTYRGDTSNTFEHFGLFIWLRVRTNPDDQSTNAMYALQLVASSTYIHHESWSFNRELKIEPASRYPAAEAVYYGRSSMLNLPTYGTTPLWNGGLAIPLFLSESTHGSLADRVLVGSIVLNTTHNPVITDPSVDRVLPTSILAALSLEKYSELSETLETVAQEILKKPN